MSIKTIGFTFCAIFLAACGSPKDANKSNFEKALNAHFAKNCISIKPFVFGAESQSYPMTIVLNQKNAFTTPERLEQNNANKTRSVDMLAKAGLLTASDGTKQVKTLFGNSEITVPTKVYNLTENGKKALVASGGTAMCVGRYKVDEVIRFTEPNNAMGHTVSEVSITASPVNVPDWTKNPEIQKTFGLDQKLALHAKMSRTVLLASDGWIDASDFSN